MAAVENAGMWRAIGPSYGGCIRRCELKQKSHVHEVITFFPDTNFQRLLQIIECLTQAHTEIMLTQLPEPIVKSR